MTDPTAPYTRRGETDSSTWEDVEDTAASGWGGLKSVFNSVNDTLDDSPNFTKGATAVLSALFLYTAGNALRERLFSGMGTFGKIGFNVLLVIGAVVAGCAAGDWMANKGADRMIDADGNVIPREQQEKIEAQAKLKAQGKTVSPAENPNDPLSKKFADRATEPEDDVGGTVPEETAPDISSADQPDLEKVALDKGITPSLS